MEKTSTGRQLFQVIHVQHLTAWTYESYDAAGTLLGCVHL